MVTRSEEGSIRRASGMIMMHAPALGTGVGCVGGILILAKRIAG